MLDSIFRRKTTSVRISLVNGKFDIIIFIRYYLVVMKKEFLILATYNTYYAISKLSKLLLYYLL